MTKSRTSAEVVAHLTDSQRLHILTEAVAKTARGEPVILHYRTFDLIEILETFLSDRNEDQSLALPGADINSTRASIARMVALRNGLQIDPPTLSIDDICAMGLAEIAQRKQHREAL